MTPVTDESASPVVLSLLRWLTGAEDRYHGGRAGWDEAIAGGWITDDHTVTSKGWDAIEEARDAC